MTGRWERLHDRWQHLTTAELPDALELRRRVHAAPEPAWEEEATAARVAAALGAAAAAPVASTGRVVRLGPDGPSVILRAELDGLPMDETTGVPWASGNGVMHSCGHDVHLGALVAVVRAARRLDLPAGLLAVLQPSEETFPSGAAQLLATGAFAGHDVRAVLAAHLQPRLPDGVASSSGGPVNASSDEFEIVVEGVGGHAGYPQLAADPVLALCSVVVALQSIVARNIDPTHAAVVSVGSVDAGAAANVIPGLARARGSAHSLAPADRPYLHRRISEVTEQVAAAHGCSGRVRVVEGEPALVNDPELADSCQRWLQRAGLRLAGPFASCGADDFAHYGALAPSLMVFVGTGTAAPDVPGLHSPAFLPGDEAVAAVARALVSAAVAAFQAIA